MTGSDSMTLTRLSQLIIGRLSVPELCRVWIVADTSDVNVRGGHCYMELIEKEEATGRTLAKARATIWASIFSRLYHKFTETAGRPLEAGIKVRVQVTVNYSPVYGFSLNVTDIDPTYTIGDALRRRMELLRRLQEEGLYDQNKTVPQPVPMMRIAVVSAAGAAGYGDFCNQLHNNPSRLRFVTKLFEAVMQGERTTPTVLDALKRIADEQEQWDCVVIIRGGGATSDLEAFDSYELAAAVAMFPLPVIVGIGHERDTSVLDYIAFKSVKTPTAAAEWLIAEATALLDHLRELAHQMVITVNRRLAGCNEQLSHCGALLSVAPLNVVERAAGHLDRLGVAVARLGQEAVAVRRQQLSAIAGRLAMLPGAIINRAGDRLNHLEGMVDILSPAATLRRGYSITRLNGHALTDASELSPDDSVETILAGGSIISTVKTITETSAQ